MLDVKIPNSPFSTFLSGDLELTIFILPNTFSASHASFSASE